MSYTYTVVAELHTGLAEELHQVRKALAAAVSEAEAFRAERDAARTERGAAQAERDALRAALDVLRREVDALKARLAQDSSNSHRPPSSDLPGAKPRVKKKSTGRKRGGQPGRKGKARALLPLDQVTDVVPCKPSHCSACGLDLRGDDPSPERHQVTEIPKVVPAVVEYRVHALGCVCGTVTHGQLPAGVSYSAFGPRLQAIVATLSAAYRLSKRNVQQVLADMLGVELSLGSISKLEMATSHALQAPVDEAMDVARQQPVAHADETSWKQGGSKAWLWTMVTNAAIVFVVRFSRGSKVAKELLGEDYGGILISDRWSGYRWVPTDRRQLCWSHLIRDFQKLADSRGPAVPIGMALGLCAKEMFRAWHQVRDRELTRAQFEAQIAETFRPQVQRLLAEGAALPDGSARKGMCAALLKVEPAMWTFARVDGVEPTNNNAERSIRHAVIWRRTSFGTQSDAGSTFVERMLTTVATLRHQRRHVLDYLTAACEAARRHQPPPSLINPA